MGCSNSTMQQAKTPRSNMPTLQREKTGFVAFQVDLQSEKIAEMNKNIDNIFAKPLPPRLQKLEPLNGAKMLTAEELEMKLKKAEIKRQKALERKLQFNRRESIKRQTDNNESRELDNKLIREKSQILLDRKNQSAEIARQKKLDEVREKQRLREEKAEQIRRRRSRLRMDEMEHFKMEQSDLRNNIENDDEIEKDIWSDDNEPPKFSKNHDKPSQQSSGYSSRNISANDSDKRSHELPVLNKPKTNFMDDVDDDFFNDDFNENSLNQHKLTHINDDYF